VTRFLGGLFRGAVLALAAGPAFAAAPALVPVDPQACPGLYRWTDTCAVYVLKQGDAALLIDLGDGRVLEHLGAIGVRRVDWVLFTHHHREQCQGATRLEEATRIAAPASEQALFESPSSFRKMVPGLNDPFTVYGASYVRPPIQPIPLDRALKDGETFTWGDYAFRCLETPGHSPGSLTYLLDRDGRTLAFSGDLMRAGARMQTWFDVEWDYGFGRGLDALLASVERCRAESPALLLPSHGPVVADPGDELTAYAHKLQALKALYLRGYPVFDISDDAKDPLSRPTPVAGIHRVTPHLYKFKRPNEGGNFSILIADSGRAIVFDCGLMDAETLDTAIAGMRQHLGLRQIEALVISHMHGDHFLLGEHLRRRYGTRVWALERMADLCEHPERYDYAAMIQSYQAGLDRLPVDRRLRDGEVIEWEGYRLQVDWMPGQTEFGCCLWLDLDGRRVAFTGDNIFADPTDPRQNGHEAVVARNSAVFEEGYLHAAEYLKRLQPDLLMGGHSFVMPEPAALVDRYGQWARDIVRAYRGLLADPDYQYRFDPYWVKAEPYRVRLEAGRSAEARIVVRNFLARAQQHEVRVCTPPGITARPASWTGEVPPASRSAFTVQLHAEAGTAPGIYLVALDSTLDGDRYGQWFDLILQVE